METTQYGSIDTASIEAMKQTAKALGYCPHKFHVSSPEYWTCEGSYCQMWNTVYRDCGLKANFGK